MATGRASGL